MGVKKDALIEIEALIRDFGLASSTIGREINGNPNLISRLRDKNTRITDYTLDAIHRYAVKKRGQLDLDLDLERKK